MDWVIFELNGGLSKLFFTICQNIWISGSCSLKLRRINWFHLNYDHERSVCTHSSSLVPSRLWNLVKITIERKGIKIRLFPRKQLLLFLTLQKLPSARNLKHLHRLCLHHASDKYRHSYFFSFKSMKGNIQAKSV